MGLQPTGTRRGLGVSAVAPCSRHCFQGRRSHADARGVNFVGVASWADFEAAQPDFARRVRKLMRSRKHLTMATVRRDGSLRISGTEVQFSGAHAQIGSMPGGVKSMDLLRDRRLAIDGPTTHPPK